LPEKDAERRFHSASDVAFDLEAIDGSGSGAWEPCRPLRPGRADGFRRSRSRRAPDDSLAWWLGTKRHPLPSSSPSEFHRLTFERGTVTGARYAPDGQTIVYTAAWNGQPARIVSTRVQAVGSTPLAMPDASLFSI
jgi:hypothetical protein